MEESNESARSNFLKAITSEWLRENDTKWVDQRINQSDTSPDTPCSQIHGALKEMLDRKVSRETIIDLVRVIQFETLFHACSTIDRTYDTGTADNWALMKLDNEYRAVSLISSLHESLLELDPSGNEMRPRK